MICDFFGLGESGGGETVLKDCEATKSSNLEKGRRRQTYWDWLSTKENYLTKGKNKGLYFDSFPNF